MSEIDAMGGGAACALHASSPAVAVCERCGSYMCDACTGGGVHRSCPTCREADGAAFDLSRTDWTVDRVFTRAWDAWKGQWLMLSLGVLIFVVLMYAVALALSLFVGVLSGILGATMGGTASGGAPPSDAAILVLAALIELVFVSVMVMVQGVLQLGLMRLCIDAIEGQVVNLGRLFGEFRKAGKLLLQFVVMIVMLWLPMAIYGGMVTGALYLGGQANNDNVVLWVSVVAGLLVIVPLVWVSLGFSFAQIELAFDDSVGAVAAIRRSFKLVSGNRLAVFAVLFLAGLIGMGGFLACCVGIFASISFAQVIISVLYLALRNGSGLPAPKHG